MTLSPDYSNIASIPFVAMALQTQEEINASYQRKMNRDYASHISNSFGNSIRIASTEYTAPSTKETLIE